MKTNLRYILYFFIVIALLVAVYSILDFTYKPSLASTGNFPLSPKWISNINASVVSLSKSDDGTIFVRNKGSLYAIQGKTGNIIWQNSLALQTGAFPAIAVNGKVYVADSEMLRAFDQTSGQSIWNLSVNDANVQVVGVTNKIVLVYHPSIGNLEAYDAMTGEILWNVSVLRGPIQVHIDRDLLYVPDEGIRAINLSTGETAWVEGKELIGGSTYLDGIIYYAGGDVYKKSVDIVAFDVYSRLELWRVAIPDSGLQRFIIENDKLIVTDSDYLYTFRASDGKILWKIKIATPMSPTVIGDNIYVMEGFSRVIRVFQLNSGSEVGFLRISFPKLFITYNQNMISMENLLIFANGSEIYAYGK